MIFSCVCCVLSSLPEALPSLCLSITHLLYQISAQRLPFPRRPLCLPFFLSSGSLIHALIHSTYHCDILTVCLPYCATNKTWGARDCVLTFYINEYILMYIKLQREGRYYLNHNVVFSSLNSKLYRKSTVK